jgi:hypothetical protein
LDEQTEIAMTLRSTSTATIAPPLLRPWIFDAPAGLILMY